VVTDDEVTVDFGSATLSFRGARHGFGPLGTVPQALVAAGGIEVQVAEQLTRRKR
jgi:hypothetical protein